MTRGELSANCHVSSQTEPNGHPRAVWREQAGFLPQGIRPGSEMRKTVHLDSRHLWPPTSYGMHPVEAKCARGSFYSCSCRGGHVEIMGCTLGCGGVCTLEFYACSCRGRPRINYGMYTCPKWSVHARVFIRPLAEDGHVENMGCTLGRSGVYTREFSLGLPPEKATN